MAPSVRPIPEGFHTITPHLVTKGAADAIAFYTRAFGATEVSRMPMPDGRLAHAELRIGDSPLFLADEFCEFGSNAPGTVGGSPVVIHLYVEDVDRAFERAVAAGATAKVPPTDMFWGDRYAKLSDPFGHEWSLATHKEDLTPEQVAERAATVMGGSA